MFPGTPVNLGRRQLTTAASSLSMSRRRNDQRNGIGCGAHNRREASQLPLSVVFDDLVRHYDLYTNYGCENEFLEFAKSQEKCRKQWADAEIECIRHQSSIDSSKTELQRAEKRIQDVRLQLENKIGSVLRLESENERIKSRMNAALTLSKRYLNDLRVGEEAKDVVLSILAVLEGVEYKRPSSQQGQSNNIRSPGMGLDTISEAETTDFSMTHSEDDLDSSVSRRTRSRRNGKRSSMDLIEEIVARETGGVVKKRRSSGGPGPKQFVEITRPAQQVIAQTVVKIPRSGPTHAVSTLETVSVNTKQTYNFENSNYTRVLHPVQPTVSGVAASESDSDSSAWQSAGGQGHIMRPPQYQTRASLAKQQQQVAQPCPPAESPRFGPTLSTTEGSMRPHAFVAKKVFMTEICDHCGDRLKFNSTVLKCKECKVTCHPDPACRDLVPLLCVIASTPGKKRHVGVIADHAPSTHPMVPALIQHCVNEVEVRGLNTVGLYRVPGHQKDVKDLKERFLRGKGVPNLGHYDIHVICGCIKDFLRSLQEPLVGQWFWRQDFAAATEISDPMTRQREINRILNELPPPNQDTLAFVILHLQRVAEQPEVKMPIGSLSRVFGPTIVGYSRADVDGPTMQKETAKQQIIVETLLSMTSDFWKRFIYRSVPKQFGPLTRSRLSSMRLNSPAATPTSKSTNNSSSIRKKIYFPDDSHMEVQFTRQKRTYFD